MIRRIARCAAAACLAVFRGARVSSRIMRKAWRSKSSSSRRFIPWTSRGFTASTSPGNRDRVRTTAALVVHTCKEGIWNLDGQFDPRRRKEGHAPDARIRICASRRSPRPTARSSCSRSATARLSRNWRFENYRLSLKRHPDKCITIGPEPSRLTRGGRRLPSRHMARFPGSRDVLGRSAREAALAAGRSP